MRVLCTECGKPGRITKTNRMTAGGRQPLLPLFGYCVPSLLGVHRVLQPHPEPVRQAGQ